MNEKQLHAALAHIFSQQPVGTNGKISVERKWKVDGSGFVSNITIEKDGTVIAVWDNELNEWLHNKDSRNRLGN